MWKVPHLGLETTPGVAPDVSLLSVDVNMGHRTMYDPSPQYPPYFVELRLETSDGMILNLTLPVPPNLDKPTVAWMLERLRSYVDRMYVVEPKDH